MVDVPFLKRSSYTIQTTNALDDILDMFPEKTTVLDNLTPEKQGTLLAKLGPEERQAVVDVQWFRIAHYKLYASMSRQSVCAAITGACCIAGGFGAHYLLHAPDIAAVPAVVLGAVISLGHMILSHPKRITELAMDRTIKSIQCSPEYESGRNKLEVLALMEGYVPKDAAKR